MTTAAELTPSIADLKKYADFQMAAEAFLEQSGVAALTEGNKRSSRFTQIQAVEFDAKYEVLEQLPNTTSGFSGTLFKDRQTGELIISFRSTEFIDDAARDNQATNALEIKEKGWAFGQIDDMRTWVDKLAAQGLITRPMTVTGYSLGGHLATAFNLLYPSMVHATYTFNGAGVGQITDGSSLTSIINEFHALRNRTDGLASEFRDPAVAAVYTEIRQQLTGGIAPTPEQYAKVRALIPTPITTFTWTPVPKEVQRLLDAMDRVKSIVDYNEYVRTLAGSGSKRDPLRVEHTAIEATKLDYQIAVLLVSRRTAAYSALNIADGESGANNTLFDERNTVAPTITNFYDVYGSTYPSAVANSQLHYGTPTPVFIEDQPLYRGTVVKDVYEASNLMTQDIRLLVRNYDKNDFGDTHSLVLLVDSLNIQNTLSQLDPTVTRQTLSYIFQAASNIKKFEAKGTQGTAEGDVLENVLDGLRHMLLNKPQNDRTTARTEGGTWANFDDRTAFYTNLKELTESQVYRDLLGKVNVKLAEGIQGEKAKTDFSTLLTLKALSPVMLAAKKGQETAVETALANGQNTTYINWLADKNLSTSEKQAGNQFYTDQWLKDRAAFLNALMQRNKNNDTFVGGAYAGGQYGRYIDADSALDVITGPGAFPGDGEKIARILFGKTTADTLTGSDNDDHIYGNDGNDNIKGGKGQDYIQGDAGNDVLSGEDNADRLLGGAGDDTLSGDGGNDLLLGGKDNDTYRFSGTFGSDTIIDIDGNNKLEIDGYANGLPTGKWLHDGYFQSEDKKVNYLLTQETRDGVLTTDLVITLTTHPGSAIRIRNFDRATRNFGITLDDTPLAPPEVQHFFTGDFIKKKPEGTSYSIIDRNYVSAGEQLNAQDVFNGTIEADSIFGLGGNDAAQGAGGDDFIDGGLGDDLLLGGYGKDTILGGGGNDHIFGSGLGWIDTPQASNFTPPASEGQEITRGFSWVVYNPPGNDTLGNDVNIYSGANVDHIEDGRYYELEGNFIDAGTGNDMVAAGTGADTVFGGEGNDTLYGMFDNDQLLGEAGDDHMLGDGNQVNYATWTPWNMHGNDTLEGGAGKDTMQGQGGSDDMYGGNDDDLMWGDDSDDKRTDYSVHGSDHMEGGGGHDQMSGGGLADELLGGEGNDSLWGDEDGTDLPDTLQGKDLLDGGVGNDQLIGGGNDDRIIGGEGNDAIWGDDSFFSHPGNQSRGDDILEGGNGLDTIAGGRGNDTLYGGAGNDGLFGDDSQLAIDQHGDDRLFGEGGEDILEGGGGNDTLDGGADKDYLRGGNGNDLLAGGTGDDTLQGEAGDDTLEGGSGTDYFDGGAGNDTYRLAIGDSPLNAQSEAEGIRDTQGRNVVEFQEGIKVESVTTNFMQGGDMVVQYSSGDYLLVKYGARQNLRFDFKETGESLSAAQLISRTSAQPQIIVGEDGLVQAYGGNESDSIAVVDKGSLAYGGRGNDILTSSVAGVDFLFGWGDGQDRIQAVSDATKEALNRLRFQGGIQSTNARWSVSGSSLKLQVNGNPNDAIYIDGFNADAGAQGLAIDQFVFDDGTVLSAEQLLAVGTDSRGTDGADLQQGAHGNDVFHASEGNDTLKGRAGSDTYQWTLGLGQDVISDGVASSVDVDRLGITDTLTTDMVSLHKLGDDLLVRSRVSDDVIRIEGHFAGKGIEEIHFEDGSIWNAAYIASHLTNELTENADTYVATAADNVINAKGGNDMVLGRWGNDHIEGGSGNDTLMGQEDNDTLIGGLGEDSMEGGLGNDVLDGRGDNAADKLIGGDGADTYWFGRGSGNDLIDERGIGTAEVDVLKIDRSVSRSDITVSYSGNLFKIQIAGTTDSVRFGMTMPEWADSNEIDRVEFDDGSTLSLAELKSMALAQASTRGADNIQGFKTDNVISSGDGNDGVTGGQGNDFIDGGNGDDVLSGNEGNDTLIGGAGIDTIYAGSGDDELIDGETMYGNSGDDVYRMTKWTNARIYETADVAGNADVLYLPVSSTTVSVSRGFNNSVGEDVDLVFTTSTPGASGAITINRYLFAEGNDEKIEFIRFSDGVEWSVADVYARDGCSLPTEGNDSISGHRWTENLSGAGGNDTIFGRQGNDTLAGDAGSDTLAGGLGNDSLLGGDGEDRLIGDDAWEGSFMTSYSAQDGADTLDGGAGNDTIYGAGGNNVYVLSATSGDDEIYAGKGQDRIVFAPDVTPGQVTLFREGDHLIVCINQDRNEAWFRDYFWDSNKKLTSMTFSNGVVWNADEIVSRTVTGTANTMTGSSGNDTFTVDHVSDVINEAAAQGADTVFASVSYTLQANLENLTLTGYLNSRLTGNDLANTLTGNVGDNSLYGGGGLDTLTGGLGNDVYVINSYDNGVPSPTDVVIEQVDGGIDTVYTALDYTLAANVENLISIGSGGIHPVRMTGNNLDNRITAVCYGDTIDGGLGADTMISDKDTFDALNSNEGTTFYVDNPGDVIITGGTYMSAKNVIGNVDTVYIAINYTLTEATENLIAKAGVGALTGTGNRLNNTMFGNGLGTHLLGLEGNDVFYGASGYVDFIYPRRSTNLWYNSLGADTFVGGTGNDTYHVEWGTDTIMEGVGEGIDTVYIATAVQGATYDLSEYQNVENLSLALKTMPAYLTLKGTSGANVINAGSVGTTVLAGDGDDTLIDGSMSQQYLNDQKLYGEDGHDTITVNGNAAIVDGGKGNDFINLKATGQTTVNFGNGYGMDRLYSSATNSGKHIAMGAGIGLQDVQWQWNEAELKTILNHGDDVLTWANYGYDNTFSGVFAGGDFRFADGTTIQRNLIVARTNAGNTNVTTEGADLLIANTQEAHLVGAGGDDVLYGSSGAETLEGGAGADTLIGGAGNDVYRVSAGGGTDVIDDQGGESDLIVFSGLTSTAATAERLDGQDIVIKFASTGDAVTIKKALVDANVRIETFRFADGVEWTMDQVIAMSNKVIGTDASETLTAGGSSLEMFGKGGNDTMYGSSGSDTIDGGSGIDSMLGGTGNDIYIVDNSSDIVVENLDEGLDDLVKASATFTLSANIERIELTGNAAINATGNALGNRMTGNDGNNNLSGGGGDDVLIGGLGLDTMAGGTGNDLFEVDQTNEVVTESSGQGNDTVRASATFTLGANIEALVLTGTAAISGTGNASNNTIEGNAAANTLNGLGGNDTMTGGLGDDIYVVDSTLDVIVENADEGFDVVQSQATYTLSSHIENLTLTGTSNISATGNDRDNVLTGNGSTNTLTGGAGHDTLIGGVGNDTLIGGTGDDVYVMDVTTDVITELADQGTDTIEIGVTHSLASVNHVENLKLTGGNAINGTGNGLRNQITGNGNANTLDGGAGIDTLVGGAGNDSYLVDDTSDVITELLNEGTDSVTATASYTLSANVENLTLSGTSGLSGTGNTLANTLKGNAGANTLTGGEGNDSIDGGAGNDVLVGGQGDDSYTVDSTADVIMELSGEGTDSVQSSATYTLSTHVENLTLTGSNAINGTGNIGDNTLIGNSNTNTLTGGQGNDVLNGMAGGDSMVGGTGNDTYVVDSLSDKTVENLGEGTDLVQSSITLTLASNIENLTLLTSSNINGTGNLLANWLIGNAGVNTLTSLDGNDTLDGGIGADSLVGGLGDDLYIVDNTSDKVTENANAGMDTVQSTAATFTLSSNVENLTLIGSGNISGTGNTLANKVTGNGGNNTLTGGGGNDTYRGGAGNDTLTATASTSSDTYIWGRGEGIDTLTDSGGTDQLQILAGVSADQVWLRRASNNLEISVIGSGDSFIITNWYSATANQVESFKLADGKTLTAANAQKLVDAMASFAPPAAGQTTLPSNYQSSLNPVIAANWV